MAARPPRESVQGRIVRVAAEPKIAPRGGYLFRGLELERNCNKDRIFLIFPVSLGRDLYDFPLLCRAGLVVAGHQLELNNRLQDGSLIFSVTPDSDVILEPHRPINVTDAIEAVHCIRSADVRFRLGAADPYWMAKGKLIHSLFDYLVGHPLETVSQSFEAAFRAALPSFREVIPGSVISADENALKDEARKHFDNLASWLAQKGSMFSLAQVEVDRISTRWGLKGRTDGVFYGNDRTTVVEIKSGHFPADEHVLQLYAYLMMFETPTTNQSTEGCLVYSATSKSRELVSQNNRMKRDILEGRNRVVSLKHAYTLRPETSQSWYGEFDCNRSGKCFSRSNCYKIFGDSFGKGSLFTGRKKEYYDHWFRLLSVEEWTLDTDFAQVLDKGSLAQRIEKGITFAISSICINETVRTDKYSRSDHSAGQWRMPFDVELESGRQRNQRSGRRNVLTEVVLHHPTVELQTGEQVMIHTGDPCSHEAFRGEIVDSSDTVMWVTLRTPVAYPTNVGLTDLTVLTQNRCWYVDRVPFSNGPRAARQALLNFFLKASPQVVQVVLDSQSEDHDVTGTSLDSGGAGPTDTGTERADISDNTDSSNSRVSSDSYGDLSFSEGLRYELNEDQEVAVKAALDCDTYHLVHGPPGTGKTRVLARLIRCCLDRGERVLLACPTNVALDRLLLSVVDLGVNDFLRIGRRSVASPEFLEALGRLGNPPALLDDLASLDMGFDEFRKAVSGKRLIAATVYQCAVHPILTNQKFHRVIVDEASQIDEPSALGALAHGDKFVLGGDHMQLPPVARTRTSASDVREYKGLEYSLFERLFHSCPDDRLSRLKIQYRMNKEIQAIPALLCYDGNLYPSPDTATRRLRIIPSVSDDPAIRKIIDPDNPAVFVGVQGPHGGTASVEEAELVCRIVGSLRAGGVPLSEIGVITPYRAQQVLIRRRLLSGGRAVQGLPSVDTVDRFQGGEKEVIIISLARSDEVTSFLADRRRMNVSLSRARSKLIVVGHGPLLEQHPLFGSILDRLTRVEINTAGRAQTNGGA
ncbi:MAG: AAA domain-containing protein [Desulfomonile sp.]|nr:AAA domain-containing protein [Deltaproteobacteria bacterium]